MVIEYCRPSWPGKHSPTPWKAKKTHPDTFVFTLTQKTQKRFLTPLFSPDTFVFTQKRFLTPLFSTDTFVFDTFVFTSVREDEESNRDRLER